MPENPTGWVKDSMYCALHAISRTQNFEDAVVYAVNLGGDADTIGAITGGLAGSICGYPAIPNRWIANLDSSICHALNDLAEIAFHEREEQGEDCHAVDKSRAYRLP